MIDNITKPKPVFTHFLFSQTSATVSFSSSVSNKQSKQSCASWSAVLEKPRHSVVSDEFTPSTVASLINTKSTHTGCVSITLRIAQNQKTATKNQTADGDTKPWKHLSNIAKMNFTASWGGFVSYRCHVTSSLQAKTARNVWTEVETEYFFSPCAPTYTLTLIPPECAPNPWRLWCPFCWVWSLWARCFHNLAAPVELHCGSTRQQLCSSGIGGRAVAVFISAGTDTNSVYQYWHTATIVF